jgi:hypothetical protein
MPESHVVWSASPSAFASFTVDAPSVKVVVGCNGDQSVRLDGFGIRSERNGRNWSCAALVTRDGARVADSHSMLLTVMDKAENRGLAWNRERTFARNAWDRSTTLVWPVTADVDIETGAKAATVWKLDVRGARAGKVESALRDGRLSFQVSGADRTVWYEIEAGR